MILAISIIVNVICIVLCIAIRHVSASKDNLIDKQYKYINALKKYNETLQEHCDWLTARVVKRTDSQSQEAEEYLH